MARKKSGIKKAKEAEVILKREEQLKAAKSSVKEATEEEFVSESESSESEDEDDYGELITDDVEEGINKVLEAIRNNDKSLLKSNVKFFKDPEEAAANFDKDPKHKAIYLKDYHRMNLLSSNVNPDDDGDDDDDDDEEEERKQKTYQEEKDKERFELISEIKDAFKGVSDDEGDGDDKFLKKKHESESKGPKRILPNPEVDEERFLQEFARQNAWIPQDGDNIINLDKRGEVDDEEFEAAAEKFENAYNFRYEDPHAAEIISYARNQATIRRNETNSRRKKRDEEKAKKELEKKDKEKAISKRKTEKINKLTDALEQIKKEYGAEINQAMVEKISASLLDNDFDDSQWDNLLAEIFNDEFYDNENVKPQWDEDDEIMMDFKPSRENDQSEEDEGEDNGATIEEPSKKKSKKEVLKEKKSKKKEKKTIKELAEKTIESQKLKIIDEIEEEREGRSKEHKNTFKYREVSPETFGLTIREIFIADDADLNEFVGLKKLAPYRTKDQRLKDRRKLAKKNLREWRKKVFKNEKDALDRYHDDDHEIFIPVEADKKSVKRKNHK